MIKLVDPWIDEKEKKAVEEVLDSKWLTQGKKTEEFEEKFAHYCGTKYALANANGTCALHLALMALGIQQGDEVIVPSFTFIATSNSVLFVGAKPVFADIQKDSFNIDPEDIRKKITKKTKAILPVHYGGQIADMDEIMEIAKEYDLVVIEDAAEAHGALYKNRKAGSIGDCACFSFTPGKNMVTGEGGMVTTNNGDIARKINLLRNHGQERKYYHTTLGFNFRITEMQAALGICQLEKLEAIIKIKNKTAEIYKEELEGINGIQTPALMPSRQHVYMLYTIKINEASGKKRDELQSYLSSEGIETRVYFPPCHLQPLYKQLRLDSAKLDNTMEVSSQVLSLPINPFIKEGEIAYIADKIRGFMGQ